MNLEEQKEKFEHLKKLVDENGPLDSDGYPTEETLSLIENWHWEDFEGCFDFVKSIWWMANWGWREEISEDKREIKVRVVDISTGGWSGNESIIEALKQNMILWSICWLQSRRGGHYIFEVRQ